MKNILIDCDPGHDDALALLVALANEEKLNVIGVSTIGGNQTLNKVTQNAKNILNFIEVNIELAMGQSKPLVKPLKTAPEAHGESGMDGPYFSGNDYPISSENSILFMYKKIIESKDKVIIVALGPLTNIALLIKTFPEVKKKIECISLMGGGLDHGNCTELAEFNIYADPEASHIVFHCDIPIIMSGLDVTEKSEITVEEIEQLKDKGKVSNLAYELLSFYNKSGEQFGFIDSPIHDLCAVAYLLDESIFEGQNYYVDVITDCGKSRGLTFADKRRIPKSKPNALVLLNVNREKFVKVLLDALKKWDSKIV